MLENGADSNVFSRLETTFAFIGEKYIIKDVKLKFYGISPLYEVCQNGAIEIAHVLVKNGADVNVCSEQVEPPLYAACDCGNNSLVELLINNGAKINLCSENVGTPIHAAC